MWILMRFKGLVIKPDYDGFELQDWETFGIPNAKTDHDWQGKILAAVITLIASWSIRILINNIFFWDILWPQCVLIGVSGVLVIADLLDFRIKKTAILIVIGLLIIFL